MNNKVTSASVSLSLRTEEILSELVHKIGHEVGNPLTSIISLATIIQRYASVKEGEPAPITLDNSKLASYAELVIEEAWKINQLMEKLVLLLSNNCGTPQALDVGEYIKNALQKMQNRSDFDSDLVSIRLEGSAPVQAHIDNELFLSIVMELLANASNEISGLLAEGSEFDSKNQSAPIEIKAESKGDFVELTVSNASRTPVYEGKLSDLFRPFVKGQRSSSGLGLGLSVVAAIAERIGGSVVLDHTSGGSGGRFSALVRLPANQGAAQETQAGRQASSRTTPGYEKLPARLTVVVVEDDNTVSSAISKILDAAFSQHCEFSCECLSGEQALDKITAGEHFDIILCDLNLSSMSGRHVYDTLNNTRPKAIPGFAFVTGDLGRSETQLFLDTLHCPYLRKPFEAQELIDLLLRLVANVFVDGSETEQKKK